MPFTDSQIFLVVRSDYDNDSAKTKKTPASLEVSYAVMTEDIAPMSHVSFVVANLQCHCRNS